MVGSGLTLISEPCVGRPRVCVRTRGKHTAGVCLRGRGRAISHNWMGAGTALNAPAGAARAPPMLVYKSGAAAEPLHPPLRRRTRRSPTTTTPACRVKRWTQSRCATRLSRSPSQPRHIASLLQL